MDCNGAKSRESPRQHVKKELAMNRDQVKGRVDQAVGKVKEETGDLLDDKSMELEGKVDKNIGKAQAEAGDAREDVKDLLNRRSP